MSLKEASPPAARHRSATVLPLVLVHLWPPLVPVDNKGSSFLSSSRYFVPIFSPFLLQRVEASCWLETICTDLFTFLSLLTWKSRWPCHTWLPLQVTQRNISHTPLWQMSKQNNKLSHVLLRQHRFFTDQSLIRANPSYRGLTLRPGFPGTPRMPSFPCEKEKTK